MKTTLELAEEKEEVIKFPVLMKWRSSKEVVLFFDEISGIRIRDDYGKEHLWFSNTLARCTDQKLWQRLPAGSKVTFTQD